MYYCTTGDFVGYFTAYKNRTSGNVLFKNLVV